MSWTCALALLAFAGNSLICRAALADGSIDPVGFTVLRLVAGALVLLPLVRRGPASARHPWSPRAALALASYAITFSLAYVSLDAGTGALLLFGTVQVTMFAVGYREGERLGRAQALGVVIAVAGVLTLLLPGASAPDPRGAALMIVAGVGWAAYSLYGRGVPVPAAATARNFLMAAPLVLALLPFTWSTLEISPRGALLAITAGALTSGGGYVIWYAALRSLDASRAAVVQLAVPVIAALGGVLLLGEVLGPRLIFAGALTLGGVALASRRSA